MGHSQHPLLEECGHCRLEFRGSSVAHHSQGHCRRHDHRHRRDAERAVAGGVTFNEAFAPGTTAYTARVPHGVTRTTVTATANGSGGSVDIDPGDEGGSGQDGHQVDLDVGDTEITVTVTAEDTTTTETYTVTVTRASAEALPSVASGEAAVETFQMLSGWTAFSGGTSYGFGPVHSNPTSTLSPDSSPIMERSTRSRCWLSTQLRAPSGWCSAPIQPRRRSRTCISMSARTGSCR